jgi:tetratricopeptide (TPR) repeat protein
VSILLVPLTAWPQQGKSADATFCREKMSHFYDKKWNGPDARKVNGIKALATECSGSVAYDYALSEAYYEVGRYPDAVNLAKRGLGIDDHFQLPLLTVMFRAMAAEGDWAAASDVVDEVIKNFPRSSVGYRLKGQYLVGVGNYPDAIVWLNKSNSMEIDSETDQILTVAYYNSNKFEDAVKAFEDSVNLDDSAMHSLAAVLAASASYYGLGKYGMSLDLLNRHEKLVPESKKDPLFIKMHAFAERALNESHKN